MLSKGVTWNNGYMVSSLKYFLDILSLSRTSTKPSHQVSHDREVEYHISSYDSTFNLRLVDYLTHLYHRSSHLESLLQ